MFEGWNRDRKKNGMVLQESKEIVQAAWLDWLSNEDSVTRDNHQKAGARCILW